jgi:glycosyltransferase involved in cell wall biosynthesis
LKIAFIGQKGLPAGSGGVEVHVEALGARLAALGHEVTVYTRPTYSDKKRIEYRGMILKSLPTLPGKHLDALVHCLLASIHASFSKTEIVHFQAHAPSVFAPLARLFKKKAVSTVHTLEYQKAKWGGPARLILKLSEWSLMRYAQAVIAVGPDVADTLRKKYRREVHLIPNGIDPARPAPAGHLEKRFAEQRLLPGNFFLFLGRLVPEKNVGLLIRAYGVARAGAADFPPLIIAGGASGSEDYLMTLEKLAAQTPGVHLIGPVTGTDKAALLQHARAFLLPSKVEGHPIVLLEALSCGLPVLASDIPSIRAVGGAPEGIGILPPDDKGKWAAALRNEQALGVLRAAADAGRDALLSRYNWDLVAAAHEEIYRGLLTPPVPAE